jgi:hypothetical protein
MLIASSGRVTSYPAQALGAVWVYNFGFITVFLFNLVFHLRKVPDSPGSDRVDTWQPCLEHGFGFRLG